MKPWMQPLMAIAATILVCAPLKAAAQEESEPLDAPPAPEVSASQYEAVWTQFIASDVTSPGGSEIRYGAKLDGYARVEGRDLGLWPGLTLSAHGEFVYGDNTNNAGAGLILPVNTALAFPGSSGTDADLAVSISQRLGPAVLTLGKINMIDRVSMTPLVGGGGRAGFQHIALAAPPTIFTPPSILGALLSFPVGRLRVSAGIWDTQSAVGKTGLENPFAEGVAGMVGVTLPIAIGGRPGFQSLTVMGNNKRGLDLEDVPDLILPPQGEAAAGERRGGWLVRYAFQQFLWQDAAKPSRGGGLFGQVSLWDENPTPLRWSLNLGLIGSVPFASRPLDRFGLAYFKTSLSPVLRRGLAPLVVLGPEQGAEAFYTIDLFKGEVQATLTAQLVDPAPEAAETAVFLGIRTMLRF